VTLHHLLSHQAGFPDANVPPAAWEDHKLLRECVCNFTLDWEPGARVVITPLPRTGFRPSSSRRSQVKTTASSSATTCWSHWDCKLAGWCAGCAARSTGGAYQRTESGEHETLAERNTPAFWRAGVPGGGYSTATDLVTFYQMLLHLGALNGTASWDRVPSIRDA
jgi:CubicO group peptidase (beta-lactamase class C family)